MFTVSLSLVFWAQEGDKLVRCDLTLVVKGRVVTLDLYGYPECCHATQIGLLKTILGRLGAYFKRKFTGLTCCIMFQTKNIASFNVSELRKIMLKFTDGLGCKEVALEDR